MSDFKLKTRKLENENIRQTLAWFCFVVCCLLFLLVASPVSFAQCLLTFVTHNSYLFCFFFNNRVVHFVVDNRFVLWMKMTMRMRWIFCLLVLHVFVSLCVVKKGEQSRRQRNGVLFVLVSVAACLSIFNSSNSVWGCCVCVSESSVIVVVLVRWAAHTERESDQTQDASSTKRANGRRGEEVCLFAVLLFFSSAILIFRLARRSLVWAENLSSLNSFSYSVYFLPFTFIIFCSRKNGVRFFFVCFVCFALFLPPSSPRPTSNQYLNY